MTLLFGCDFSSSPSRRKPIVIAAGRSSGDVVALDRIESFTTLDSWGEWLCATPEWIGAFDFPFGLPRELVEALGWPLQWQALIAHYARLNRQDIRSAFSAFCAARPVGGKFAHRATDGPAGSSPSMKWVNPPVAFMLHAGVPRLIAAGALLPGLHAPPGGSGADRVALEAYPGLLARELIGRRSYKNDAVALQTAERAAARDALLTALARGATRLGLRISLSAEQRATVMADATGDRLDAVLCLVQAAWSAARAASTGPGYGLPTDIDPLEGWIATA